MGNLSSKRPILQLKHRHSSLRSAVEGAIFFIVNFSEISYPALLSYCRKELLLTRSQVQKAVDSLAAGGRVKLEVVLDCIIIRAVQNGGVR